MSHDSGYEDPKNLIKYEIFTYVVQRLFYFLKGKINIDGGDLLKADGS